MQILKFKDFSLLLFAPLLFALVLFFSSCDPIEKEKDKDLSGNATSDKTSKVFVLNEGLYAMNNSSLSLLDLKTETVELDMFLRVNKRGLGDTGNELKRYGSKMYAAISGSNIVEVMEVETAKSVAQIKLYNEKGVGRQPRRLTFWEGKAYVACFDGTVCKIDTASLQVEAVTRVGRNPDGICAVSGKIYVSNSGGLDYPRYDSTVSVVSVSDFREIKKIPLNINPFTIEADKNGMVYVCTRGNYQEVSAGDPLGYGFQCIDSKTDQVLKSFEDLAVLNFTICGDSAYLYNYDYKQKTSWIKIFDLNKGRVVNEDFIGGNTDLKTPYGMGVDPYSGDVYIADAYNFMVSGRVYCFYPSGKMKFWRNVGLNPQSFVFVK